MPLPKEPEKEFFRESEKTDTVNDKDGVYEFWWNVTMLLRVAAPQTPVMIDGFWEDPQT